MESMLRKVVWLFREQPIIAYGGLVGLGVVSGVVLRRLLSSSAAGGVCVLDTATQLDQLRALIDEKWASSSSDLVPLSTSASIVSDAGMDFILTVVNAQAAAQKPGASGPSKQAPPERKDAFASLPDKQKIVTLRTGPAPAAGGSSSSTSATTHTLLFNKFYVVPRHIVAITSDFQSQQLPMSASDFAAAWALVSSQDGLAFYNAGFNSGASQPRRHVQFVPFEALHAALPSDAAAKLKAVGADVPLDILIAKYRAGRGWVGPDAGNPVSLPSLPFNHTLWLNGADVGRMGLHEAAGVLFSRYIAAAKAHEVAVRTARAAAGGGGGSSGSSQDSEPFPSHNLLLTPTWMLYVPRTREFALPGHRVSVNSLGYAGMLLARPPDDAELKGVGLMEALRVAAQEAPE